MPATKTSSRKSSAPLKAAKKAVAPKPTVKKAIQSKAEDGVPLSTIIRRRHPAKTTRFPANAKHSPFFFSGGFKIG